MNALTNEEQQMLQRITDNFKKMSPENKRAYTTALDITATIERIKEDQR